MVFGLRKVKVGGPINFQQWNLDQQVRGLRLEVDKDNDLIALPVLVVDTTGEPSTLTSSISTPTVQTIRGSIKSSFGPTTFWTPDAGKRIRLLGGVISGSNLTLAAAGTEYIVIETNSSAYILELTQQLDAAVPKDLAPFEFSLGPVGYLAPTDFYIDIRLLTALATGQYVVWVWGSED